MIKLASEKNLNKFSFPVISTKGKPLCHNKILSFGSHKFLCETGHYGAKQMMIMDLLGTYLIHKLYNKNTDIISFNSKIPTSNDSRVKECSERYMSKEILEIMIDEIYNNPNKSNIIPEKFYLNDMIIKNVSKGRLKKIQVINFSDKEIKKLIPNFKKYTSLNFLDMITKMSECKFFMNYPIRIFNNSKYENINYNNYTISSNFFRLVEVKEIKNSDGKVNNREYTISFDTILGYIFVQNTISCYHDLLPINFYDMSEYSQLFYRMLIVPYFNDVKNPISLNEIKTKMVFKSHYENRKVVKNIFDELIDFKFVEKYTEFKKDGEYFYKYKKINWFELDAKTEKLEVPLNGF